MCALPRKTFAKCTLTVPCVSRKGDAVFKCKGSRLGTSRLLREPPPHEGVVKLVSRTLFDGGLSPFSFHPAGRTLLRTFLCRAFGARGIPMSHLFDCVPYRSRVRFGCFLLKLLRYTLYVLRPPTDRAAECGLVRDPPRGDCPRQRHWDAKLGRPLLGQGYSLHHLRHRVCAQCFHSFVTVLKPEGAKKRGAKLLLILCSH